MPTNQHKSGSLRRRLLHPEWSGAAQEIAEEASLLRSMETSSGRSLEIVETEHFAVGSNAAAFMQKRRTNL